MNHKYHYELKKAKFKFTPGSGCNCKDFYQKQIGEGLFVFLRKEKCDSGKPHRRCKWEMILMEQGKGQTDKAGAEGTFMDIQNILTQWMA